MKGSKTPRHRSATSFRFYVKQQQSKEQFSRVPKTRRRLALRDLLAYMAGMHCRPSFSLSDLEKAVRTDHHTSEIRANTIIRYQKHKYCITLTYQYSYNLRCVEGSSRYQRYAGFVSFLSVFGMPSPAGQESGGSIGRTTL